MAYRTPSSPPRSSTSKRATPRRGPRRGGEDRGGGCSAGEEWRQAVRYATLDLSGTYPAVFDAVLAQAIQVADPFHVVKLANERLEECRRRVQTTRSAIGAASTTRCSAADGSDQGRGAAERARTGQAARPARPVTPRARWRRPGTPKRPSASSDPPRPDPGGRVGRPSERGHDRPRPAPRSAALGRTLRAGACRSRRGTLLVHQRDRPRRSTTSSTG